MTIRYQDNTDHEYKKRPSDESNNAPYLLHTDGRDVGSNVRIFDTLHKAMDSGEEETESSRKDIMIICNNELIIIYHYSRPMPYNELEFCGWYKGEYTRYPHRVDTNDEAIS